MFNKISPVCHLEFDFFTIQVCLWKYVGDDVGDMASRLEMFVCCNMLFTLTSVLFEEVENPEEDEPEAKVTKNKIPKRIRLLMKKKKKLSSQILASSSWRKNYKTMVELEKVEEEIDKEYKARRLMEEKKAIGAIKRNPKYFYTYVEMSRNAFMKGSEIKSPHFGFK